MKEMMSMMRTCMKGDGGTCDCTGMKSQAEEGSFDCCSMIVKMINRTREENGESDNREGSAV